MLFSEPYLNADKSWYVYTIAVYLRMHGNDADPLVFEKNNTKLKRSLAISYTHRLLLQAFAQ